MAREIMSDLEPDLPPLVNCCKIYRAIGSSDSGLNHRTEGWQWVGLYLQGSGTAHRICAHSIRRSLLVDLPVSLRSFILIDRFVMLSCFPRCLVSKCTLGGHRRGRSHRVRVRFDMIKSGREHGRIFRTMGRSLLHDLVIVVFAIHSAQWGDLGGEVAYRRIGPRRRCDGEGSYILDPQSSYSDFRRHCYHRLCHPSLATFEV